MLTNKNRFTNVFFVVEIFQVVACRNFRSINEVNRCRKRENDSSNLLRVGHQLCRHSLKDSAFFLLLLLLFLIAFRMNSLVKSSTKLLAFYSVHWEKKFSDQIDEMSLQINSCLFFQRHDDDDDDDELNQIRRDGCGYVINYPEEISSIYNFDRPKHFLLTSDQIYPSSKKLFFSSSFVFSIASFLFCSS